MSEPKKPGRPKGTGKPPANRPKQTGKQAPKTLRDKSGKWIKGTPSPNPSGRPAKQPLTEQLRLALEDPKTVSKFIASMLKQVAKGDTAAARLLWDRSEGAVRQNIGVDATAAVMNIEAENQDAAFIRFIEERHPELITEFHDYLLQVREEEIAIHGGNGQG